MAVESLRKRALNLHEELEHLLQFTLSMSPINNERLKKMQSDIDLASRKNLYDIIRKLENNIHEIRSRYGPIAPKTAFRELAVQAKQAKADGKIFQLGKVDIDDSFFKKFEEVIPEWRSLPHHILACFDPDEIIAGSRPINYRLLEATLFEDMCSLYNRCVHLSQKTDSLSVFQIKERDALLRATAVLSVSFVEAYLNGLAFRCLREKKGIRPADEVLLKEWDSKNNRPKFTQLREKILHYPRIYLGEKHPFLNPGIKEFDKFMTLGKEIRDAIAHPSPIGDPTSGEIKKLKAVFNIDLATVKEIVNAAIRLVKVIEERVKSNPWMDWLIEIDGATGLFPEKAFR